jgi:hypothetical protein
MSTPTQTCRAYSSAWVPELYRDMDVTHIPMESRWPDKYNHHTHSLVLYDPIPREDVDLTQRLTILVALTLVNASLTFYLSVEDIVSSIPTNIQHLWFAYDTRYLKKFNEVPFPPDFLLSLTRFQHVRSLNWVVCEGVVLVDDFLHLLRSCPGLTELTLETSRSHTPSPTPRSTRSLPLYLSFVQPSRAQTLKACMWAMAAQAPSRHDHRVGRRTRAAARPRYSVSCGPNRETLSRRRHVLALWRAGTRCHALESLRIAYTSSSWTGVPVCTAST